MRLHYPLLVASAYSGFAVWHMGYSATGPLTAATPGSFVEEAIGRTIPITDTVYSWWNLTAIVVAVAAIVGSMVLLAPKDGDAVVELPEQMHVTTSPSTWGLRRPPRRSLRQRGR